MAQPLLLLLGLHRGLDEVVHARPSIASLHDLRQHHCVRHLHARAQRLGLRGDKPLECLLVPADEPVGRFCRLDFPGALGVAARLGQGPVTLYVVDGGLDDDRALLVKAASPRTPCDLMELPSVEAPLTRPVEFGQRRHHHRTDGHVDADAKRVRAADDGKQARLGKTFHRPAVPRQHAGMMHANPHEDQAFQRLAKSGGKPDSPNRLLYRLALLLGRDPEARQRLRAFMGCILREMDDVEWSLIAPQRKLYRSLET